jgi:hypothetical protein
MNIKQGPDAQQQIGKRLHEIVDGCLEIDITDVQKRQKVESDRQR